MPLPTLNTKGPDLANFGDSSNQLLKIIDMENKASQGEHYKLQNALLKRKLSPESLAGENALLQLKQNKEEADNRRSSLEDTAKALAWIKEQPNPDEAYKMFQDEKTREFLASNGKAGVHPTFLPDTDLFYTKAYDEKLGKEVTRWDADAFNQFANGGQLAMKAQLHPEEGKTFDLVMRNPKYDPESPADESKYLKLHMMIKNGKQESMGTSVVDSPLAADKKEGKAPETKTFPVGGKDVPHQWNAESGAWEPIKGMGGPRWKAGDGEKPEYKPGQALKRGSAIKSMKSKLQSGGAVDALMLSQFPEYAGLIASGDPQAKEAAIKALDDEYAHVSKFFPKGTAPEKPTPAKPTPAGGGVPGSKNFGNLWGGTDKPNRPSPVF